MTTSLCQAFSCLNILNLYSENIMGIILLFTKLLIVKHCNLVLLCEYFGGLFPCSLSLAGTSFKVPVVQLDRTILWEDNQTLPRTISSFTRLVLDGFHAGFVGLRSYDEREVREQQQIKFISVMKILLIFGYWQNRYLGIIGIK